MKPLGKWVLLAGSAMLGTMACSSSFGSAVSLAEFGDAEGTDSATPGTGFASGTCTEDGGVLTPIGPQGCAPNQTIVYRKPVAGSGPSAIGSGASRGGTPTSGSLTACTDTKCGPGQVAVVTYQATGPVLDASPAKVPDDAGTILADGAGPPPVDAAPLPDANAPDAPPLTTADASDDATASADDGGSIGIPCGAVVTCVDQPPTCPSGQSPSYTPSGKWHCLPLCNASDGSTVVITYGVSYGNATICAGAPPTAACPSGDVWTWDFNEEAWVCAPECDNGQYDRRDYGGQTVCVPC